MRLSVAFAALLSACNQPTPPAATFEPLPPDPLLRTRVEAKDPDAQRSLRKGFYAVEQGQWRWTAPHFTARFSQPAMVLRMRFTLPEVRFKSVKQIKIAARLNGTLLAPEVYDKPGDYVYSRPIDPKQFAGPAQVEFDVDPPYKPGGADTRDLGLIVYSIGFEVP